VVSQPSASSSSSGYPGSVCTTSSTTWNRALCTASRTGSPSSSAPTRVCIRALRIREAPAEPAAPVAEAVEPSERWKGVAEPGTPIAQGLDAIVAEDPTFDLKHFLAGARAAYEMIVTAYAEGDRRSLKNLLSRDVYEGFDAAIREREAKGETAESRFVSIDKSDITAADLKGRTVQITVRFVSQLVSLTRDRNGAVIDGSPDKVTDVTDVWTFARDLSSRDPNWKLVATEAGQ